ncbi:hypothetical protein BD413DRAFT_516343 [Trametes elegans]|nr:hypothetical protein BD413DRAFT_516343 [Trametes elegans]
MTDGRRERMPACFSRQRESWVKHRTRPSLHRASRTDQAKPSLRACHHERDFCGQLTLGSRAI